jgi:hypothetical protein
VPGPGVILLVALVSKSVILFCLLKRGAPLFLNLLRKYLPVAFTPNYGAYAPGPGSAMDFLISLSSNRLPYLERIMEPEALNFE